MKRFLKWFSIVTAAIAVAAFVAFLYFMPPFDFIAPEQISRLNGMAGPDLRSIANPRDRALAERGHYLVTIGSCGDCHATPGPRGPQLETMYLAGGMKMSRKGNGTYISRNLTPDRATGLGDWSDEDITRVLRNGITRDGREVPGHLMPWPAFSNWTEEDRYAVVVYLRHVAAIAHKVPPPAAGVTISDPAAQEEIFGGRDYAAGNP